MIPVTTQYVYHRGSGPFSWCNCRQDTGGQKTFLPGVNSRSIVQCPVASPSSDPAPQASGPTWAEFGKKRATDSSKRMIRREATNQGLAIKRWQ